MAKQHKRTKPKGKAQASKPITSHQLFPAVVALWFGALFGLGSLAVRPTLIESLVMKSRLDLIVPAAAPPLGITARMLIALVLATIGAALGVVIARRLARPKVEQRQRKRDKFSGDAELGGYASRSGYAAPLSVHDDVGDDADAGGVLAGRRRATLAYEHEELDFVPHEMAPLPGGAPQVLDITGVELADYAPVEPAEFVPTPLDLGAFAEPAPGQLHPTAFAPFSSPDRQVFQPVAAPVMDPPAVEPAQTGRQIFGMAIEDDHVDQSYVRAAGFKTTVFDQEEHEPLFHGRSAVPEAVEPVDTAPLQPPFAPVVAAEPVAIAAPAQFAPELPPVSGLGMTDLASRLQQSMQRRRAARNGPEMPPEAPVFAPAIGPEPVLAEPEPAPFAAPPFIAAEAAATPDVEASGFAAPAAAEPFASLLSPAPVDAAPDLAAVIPPAPMAMPAALRPMRFDDADDGADDGADDMLASLLPPRNIPLPVPAPAAPFTAPLAAVPAPEALQLVPVELGEEESYASLLDIGQPLSARTQFVRIDEPEAVDAPVEPVVIFPGQTPLAAVPGESEALPFRRFDAPSTAGQGGPVASAAGQAATDPAEAEQALRAALANLQRMSGAA